MRHTAYIAEQSCPTKKTARGQSSCSLPAGGENRLLLARICQKSNPAQSRNRFRGAALTISQSINVIFEPRGLLAYRHLGICWRTSIASHQSHESHGGSPRHFTENRSNLNIGKLTKTVNPIQSGRTLIRASGGSNDVFGMPLRYASET